MARKMGLGKGLDILIPQRTSEPAASETKAEEKHEESVVTVSEPEVTKTVKDSVKKEKKTELKLKISEIEPCRNQPRKSFNEDLLEELAESIKMFGVIQPLIVQKKNDYYEIIAGERRWRAAKMAGLAEVPVLIKDYTDAEMLEISLIENIQREDLNPIEEARAYQRLGVEYGLKQDEIAEKVSKNRTTITNSIRLLKLCEPVQQMILDEMITAGHARALLAVDDLELQETIANQIFEEKMSVRETEKLIKNVLKKKDKKETEKESPVDTTAFIYEEIEERIKTILGTKVKVNHNANHKGKIQIDYYSDADLERILDLLQSIQK